MDPRRTKALGVSWAAILAAVAVLVMGTGCGSTTSLQSRSLDREIVIDGDEGDWSGVLIPIEKEDLTLGILNDDQYLYVSLIVNDWAVARQIFGAGLTMWFDPAGGKEQTYGIRFPLGMRQRGAADAPVGQRGEPLDQLVIERAMAEFELVGEAGQAMRYPRDGVPGIEISATMEFGTLVYELKVPLATNDLYPFAVGALPGSTIGFGLETTPQDLDGQRGSPRGAPGGGFGGGDRRGAGGGFGGGSPGRRPLIAESLKMWTTVQLAASP